MPFNVTTEGGTKVSFSQGQDMIEAVRGGRAGFGQLHRGAENVEVQTKRLSGHLVHYVRPKVGVVEIRTIISQRTGMPTYLLRETASEVAKVFDYMDIC